MSSDRSDPRSVQLNQVIADYLADAHARVHPPCQPAVRAESDQVRPCTKLCQAFYVLAKRSENRDSVSVYTWRH